MADVYRRCGCRDEHGKTLGNRCPKLENPKHGAWAFYLAAGTDPITGKRRQVRQGGFASKQAAQKARNEAAVKLDRGTYVAPTRELYGAYILRWLDHHQKTGRGLKASTMVNYRRYVELDIAPSPLGSVPLSEVRRFHVNAFIKQLLDDGRGATTVRRIVAVVQGSLRSAAEENLIDHNPATGLKLPAVSKKELEVWEPAQVGEFLDVAAGHRLSALFELAMFTGMRRGELLGLRWTDVDMTRRAVTVRNNRIQAGTEIVEAAPKTRAGRRTVDLDDRSSGALVRWRLAQQEEAADWGDAYTETGYVFTYEDGQPLRPQYASRLFDKLRVEAGLPKMTFHGQRHENASLMIAAGTDIAIVSKRLGHSSVSITGDICSHLIGSASRHAAESTAALVPVKSAGAHTLHTQEAER
ncbi:tyrosine-type recombinase/integrase [Agromyces humatus]|uniref:Site-specific integrase n=1 Tax=Agromyces humatus TaxID=279573 RepID=A0ABN2KX07_9MICO|nr:tyrosine-type recombinase/integrase [Agromyces humatus]